MGIHGAAGVSSERRRSSCSSFNRFNRFHLHFHAEIALRFNVVYIPIEYWFTFYHIHTIYCLKNVLLFREIYELYNGEFPTLDVFSDCLCPGTHPRAVTNHTGLDLYCAQNINHFNLRRRDNPLSEAFFNEPAIPVAGLYIPQFLTDGMVLPIESFYTVRITF